MDNDTVLDAEVELFGAIFLLSQHLTRLADADIEHLGLTTKQWLLLMVLTRKFSGQNPTVTEAAQVYGTSRQNVKQIALQLEERGYLKLVPDPEDRRALRLQITDKISVFQEPGEQARQINFLVSLFQKLQPEEVLQLRRLVVLWLRTLAPHLVQTAVDND